MSKPASEKQFLIAGGGIAGLATSIALGRMGIPVRMLERVEAFSDEGAGIQLGPNATKILDEWGVLDRLGKKAVMSEGIAIGDGMTGEHLATVPFGKTAVERYGAPFLLVHRSDLHDALLDAARSYADFKIEMGREALSFTQSTAGVTVATNEGEIEGRALIVADGLWSKLRNEIDRGAALNYAGGLAWRSLIDAGDMPEPLHGPWTGLWLGKAAHLVHYPVCGGDKINIVAVINDRWGGGSEGWSHEGDPDFLLPHFDAWNDTPAEVVRTATNWRVWPLFKMSPLRAWAQGAITLIGDAAHPVLPFLAQGGGMAIEDAVVLAKKLDENDHDPWLSFQPFEIARIERTARTSYESRRMGKIYHMGGLMRLARNLVLRHRSPGALLKQFDWLYSFDADKSAK